MRIINNQFHIRKKIYRLEEILTPEKRIGKLVPTNFSDVNDLPADQIFIEYCSDKEIEHKRRRPNSRSFTLRLYGNGRFVEESEKVSITESGNNEEYENTVRLMIKKALMITKRN